MRPDRVISMLSIAAKAGSVVSGEFSTEKAVKEGKAQLVIVGTDVSENTHKKFSDMCTFYKVPFYTYADKDTLGHGIGKEMRASVAVTDAGIAKAVIRHLEA